MTMQEFEKRNAYTEIIYQYIVNSEEGQAMLTRCYLDIASGSGAFPGNDGEEYDRDTLIDSLESEIYYEIDDMITNTYKNEAIGDLLEEAFFSIDFRQIAAYLVETKTGIDDAFQMMNQEDKVRG